MRLFSEKVSPTFNSSGYNILTVKDYTEVFFDVYEFEINGSKFVAEKTGVLDDAPIISIPVTYKESVSQYDFVLHKGEQSIHFDPNTKSIPTSSPAYSDTDLVLSESAVVEESDEVFLEEKRSVIIEEINKAKAAAAQYLSNLDKQNKRSLTKYQTEKEIALKEDIDKQKRILFDEFQSFIEDLRNDLLESDESSKEVLGQLIISELSEATKQLNTKLVSIENAVESKLEERATLLLNDVLLREIERSSKSISESLDSRVTSIEQSLNNTLDETKNQIASNITEKLQEISTELNAKDSSIVELNNSINKQSNKALSRIGTVKTQLEESLSTAVNLLESRIDSASTKLEEYYNNKISVVEEAMSALSDETKQHVINLIKESKTSLLEEINNIKVTVPNIVIERSNGKQEIDIQSLKTELEKSVSNRFVNEISSLKRLIELSSGGGSVAKQFADGGTMNGNLTVTGAISASQYLGLSIPSGEYLPLSGGTVTGNVSIVGELSANSIQMNTSLPSLTARAGQLSWNDEDGTLNLGLKGNSVTLQIGQESVARVVNKTNGNLLQSEYKVVRIRSTAEGGSQGQRLAVVLAQANNDPSSVDTLGLVTENITKNQEGFVTTSGLVRNIDTTGTLQGETWSDGDVLYLSPTTAGRLTNIKPQAPNHTVVMGFVVYAHQNNGKIYVKVDNGYEIDELHNVKITSVSANDVLSYDGAQRVWRNTNTLVLSSLSADRIYTNQIDALSANITVIDIKQYELSGFNVTGDVTINGTVSAGNLSAGDIYSNSNRVATVVDPVRTTLTGNGTLSTFPISGASGLVNPSALIVAIDGALQEPSVDYTVTSGAITFTSPLPNGSKAVVISPTNTLQVSNMIPADGSVTSAKIVGGVSLSDATLINTTTLQNITYSTIQNAENHVSTLGLISKPLFQKSFIHAREYLYNASNQTTNRYGWTARAVYTANITASANFTKGTKGEILSAGQSVNFTNTGITGDFTSDLTWVAIFRPIGTSNSFSIMRNRSYNAFYTTTNGGTVTAQYYTPSGAVLLASKIVPATDFVCMAWSGNNLLTRAGIWHNNTWVSGSYPEGSITTNGAMETLQIGAGQGGAGNGLEFVAFASYTGLLTEQELGILARRFFETHA